MRCIKAFALVLMIPSLVWADGVLTPAANPAQPFTLISSSGIPFIKASSGTMGNNGAVSAMTALPRTFSGGAYLYLPANAISAGSAAGWYWFVASSTTAGTVYNSTYTSGHPRVGVTTAFATTGPGAFTGATTAITGPSLTVPANLMGTNGRLAIRVAASNNNSAGSKALNITFGGTTCTQLSNTTAISMWGDCSITNRGLATIQAAQVLFGSSAGVYNQVQISTDMTINTAADATLAMTMTTSGAATDHQIIEQYAVEVYTKN